MADEITQNELLEHLHRMESLTDARFEQGSQRIDVLSKKVERVEKNTDVLVEIVQAFAGVGKVLNWISVGAKKLAPVLLVFGAILGFLHNTWGNIYNWFLHLVGK